MKPTYEIRIGSLAGFDTLVPQLGGVPAELLARTSLPPNCVRRPEILISISTLVDLLNVCKQELQCDDFGLRLAELQGLRMLGILGKLLLNGGNLDTALSACHRYMVLHNQADHWRLSERGERLQAQRISHYSGLSDTDQYSELAMGAACRLFRELAGTDIRPLQVLFRHTPVSSMQRYREYFDAEVLFAQERDCLIFDATLLRRPINTPAPSLINYFEKFTHGLIKQYQGDIAAQVRTLILQTLGAKQHSLAQISQLMDVPMRTLQRRLSDSGTSFRQLLQQARMETARWHLRASSIDIGLLSASLGYTDISAFSKAFRSIHGSSPLQWRKYQREIH
ncbi:AraC family transcriptional regulator [Microbulbifer sp. 2205BS26-8]|uniref:AraC family transcriptional regulator n=1 Tax=Microbulbifer sp. 2205BS26-8 TaxID=3064386 RepID=UPI00273F99A4|nr:AraC family transcriptional regulator [Microbulbifer sp. 2205BS26-8]MDP5209797.1 AraC family transcriptional regulator [Microbulbifer sp. 2205BS26-8]